MNGDFKIQCCDILLSPLSDKVPEKGAIPNEVILYARERKAVDNDSLPLARITFLHNSIMNKKRFYV